MRKRRGSHVCIAQPSRRAQRAQQRPQRGTVHSTARVRARPMAHRPCSPPSPPNLPLAPPSLLPPLRVATPSVMPPMSPIAKQHTPCSRRVASPKSLRTSPPPPSPPLALKRPYTPRRSPPSHHQHPFATPPRSVSPSRQRRRLLSAPLPPPRRSPLHPPTKPPQFRRHHAPDQPHSAPAHTQPVTSAAYSADSRSAVSTSVDHTAKLWDLRPHLPPYFLRLRCTMQHPARVYRAALSADASVAVTTCEDGNARVWYMSGSYCTPHKLSFSAQHNNARACAISPEGQYAALSFYKGLRRKIGDNDQPMSSFHSQIYLVQLRDRRQIFFRAEYGIADQIVISQHASVVAIGLCDVRPARTRAKGHRIVLLSRDGLVLKVVKDCFPLHNHSCTAWHMPRFGHMLAICSKHDNLQVYHAGPRQLWKSIPTVLSSPTVRSFTVCRFMHDHDLLAAVGTSTTTKQACLLVFRISTSSVLFHLPTQPSPAAVHDIYPRIAVSNPSYDPQLNLPFARILASAHPNAAALINLRLGASHSPDVNKSQPSSSSSSRASPSPNQDTPQFHLCREPSIVLNPRAPSPSSSMIKSSESSTRTPLYSRFRNWVTDKRSSQNASTSGIQWRNPPVSVQQRAASLLKHLDENGFKLAAQRSEQLTPTARSTPHSVSSPKEHAVECPSTAVPQKSLQPSSGSKSQNKSKGGENAQNLPIRKTHPIEKSKHPILMDSKISNEQRENDCGPSAHAEEKPKAEKKHGLDEALNCNKNKSPQMQGALAQNDLKQDEISPGEINTSGTDGCWKDKAPSHGKVVAHQSRVSVHGTKTDDQEKHCDKPRRSIGHSQLSSGPHQLDKDGPPKKTSTRQVINGSNSLSPIRGETNRPAEDQRERNEIISLLDSPDSNDWTPATRYAVRAQNKRGSTTAYVQNSTKEYSTLNELKIKVFCPSVSTKGVRRCTEANPGSQTNVCTSFATDKEGLKSPSNSGTALSDPVANSVPTLNAKETMDNQISPITAARDFVKICEDGDRAASSKANDGLETVEEYDKPIGLIDDDLRSRENGYGKIERAVVDSATFGTPKNDTPKQGRMRKEEGLSLKEHGNPNCKRELVVDSMRPKLSFVPLANAVLKTDEKTTASVPIEALKRCKDLFAEALQKVVVTERNTLTNQEAYTTMLSFVQKEGVYTDKKSIARVIYRTVGIKNSCTLEMFVESFTQIFAHSRALRRQRWTAVFTAATCDEGESILVFHARDLMKTEYEEGHVHIDRKWTDDTIESVFERVSDGILVDLPSFLRGVEELLDC